MDKELRQEAKDLIETLITEKKESCPTVYKMYQNSDTQIVNEVLSTYMQGAATSYEAAISLLEKNYNLNNY